MKANQNCIQIETCSFEETAVWKMWSKIKEEVEEVHSRHGHIE
jgi:hypothetical protein